MIRSCSLKPQQILETAAASRKRFLRRYFSIFELGCLTKHMTDPAGNNELRFPSSSTLKVWEKQNSLCRLEPVIKYLLFYLLSLEHPSGLKLFSGTKYLRKRVSIILEPMSEHSAERKIISSNFEKTRRPDERTIASLYFNYKRSSSTLPIH